ncbi:hypothetical protein TB2_000074 [Malus domestica]
MDAEADNTIQDLSGGGSSFLVGLELDHDGDRQTLEQAGLEVPRESRRCSQHPTMVVRVEPRVELRSMSSNSGQVVAVVVVEVVGEDNRVGVEGRW